MSRLPLRSGVHLRHYGPQWRDIDLAGSARLVEEVGLDSIWLSDHVVLTDDATSPYPFSIDGKFFLPAGTDWLEWTTTAAFLAAHTHTIDIGVGVCVMPLRHPLLLAKQVATLDQLSGGRVRLGVGAGWLAEEFDALGRNFADRGRAVDGGLRLLREAWTGSPAAGEYGPYRIGPGVRTEPRPTQGQAPVYVGGDSPAALRRVVQYGDGWYGTAAGGQMELDHLRSVVQRIRELCNRHQRDPDELDIALRVAAPGREVGTPEFHNVLAAYVRAGVSRLSFDVGWRAPAQMRPRLSRLAEAFAEVRDATS